MRRANARPRTPARRTPATTVLFGPGEQDAFDAARDAKQATGDAKLATQAAHDASHRSPRPPHSLTLFPPRYEVSVYCPICHAAQVFIGTDGVLLGTAAAEWQRAHEEQTGGVGKGHSTQLGAALLSPMLPIPPTD